MKNTTTLSDAREKSPRNQVGVHLDLNTLRVVEVSHGHLKDWQSTPYPPGLQPGAPGFSDFLKSTLADISGIRHAPVWVVGPAPSLQVRFLSLPKARPRQVSNLVYWTFRKEIPFDAARTYFDYDVEGEGAEPGQNRHMDVTAYTVGHDDVSALTALFHEAGINVEGVMIPSFALRTVFRGLHRAPGEVSLGLFVGEDASSIMFMKGQHVLSHRVFKTGMNAMLDVLRDRHPDWSSAKAQSEMMRAMQPGASAISVRASSSSASADARIRETVEAAFGRLVQQVERSVSAYLVGRADDEIKTIYVAGPLAELPGLLEHMGSRLGLQVTPMDGFAGRLSRSGGQAAPPTPSESAGMTIALGAALADPLHAPNLLHTYVRREREERAARSRRLVLAGGLAGIALLALANGVITRSNQQLRIELQQQRERLERFAPYPDRGSIEAMMTEATRDSARLKGLARRCLPLAILNQLAGNTPRDIRLQRIELQGDGASERLSIALQGQVSGDPELQESRLASYIMRLEDSRLLEQVALGHATEGREDREPVLLFALRMQVEELDASDPPLPSLAKVSRPALTGGLP